MASLQEMEQMAMMQQPVRSPEDMQHLLDSEFYKFSQMLLTDDMKNVPEDLREKFWVFFDKELSLTNLTPDAVKWIMFQFDIAKLDSMIAKPDFELKFEDSGDATNMKVKAFAKIMRSTSPKRERELLATQIRQSIISDESSGVSGGFLSKVGGVFKGRKK